MTYRFRFTLCFFRSASSSLRNLANSLALRLQDSDRDGRARLLGFHPEHGLTSFVNGLYFLALPLLDSLEQRIGVEDAGQGIEIADHVVILDRVVGLGDLDPLSARQPDTG